MCIYTGIYMRICIYICVYVGRSTINARPVPPHFFFPPTFRYYTMTAY